MRPITKIAGDLLLFFYARQRERGFSDDQVIEFGRAGDKGVVMDNSSLSNEIRKVCGESAIDTYNAICYLQENFFINYKESEDNVSKYIHSIRVIAPGINIIEDIERNDAGRDKFHVTFNIKLAENINVESLLKTELGGLIRVGL